MEAAAVRLYFLLEHNYSLVTMSCILHIIWVNLCTRNKIKENIARGLCTLVPFIQVAMPCMITNLDFLRLALPCSARQPLNSAGVVLLQSRPAL